MMDLRLLLLFACATVVLAGFKECGSDIKHKKKVKGTRLTGFFNKGTVVLDFPCKFPAVRQKCGIYEINLTPGNLYRFNKYYIDTMWLGIKTDESEWKGRTTNKIAVKFLNGNTNELFVARPDINWNTSSIMRFEKDSDGFTYAIALNDDFKITYRPWEPENTDFETPLWKFYCNVNGNTTLYPGQVCGIQNSKSIDKRAKDLGLERDLVILFDILNATAVDVVQTDDQCIKSTEIFQNCPVADRLPAIRTCSQILFDEERRKCITRYDCSPMHAFNECLTWACTKFNRTHESCEQLGATIDSCRNFIEGNLTKKYERCQLL